MSATTTFSYNSVQNIFFELYQGTLYMRKVLGSSNHFLKHVLEEYIYLFRELYKFVMEVIKILGKSLPNMTELKIVIPLQLFLETSAESIKWLKEIKSLAFDGLGPAGKGAIRDIAKVVSTMVLAWKKVKIAGSEQNYSIANTIASFLKLIKMFLQPTMIYLMNSQDYGYLASTIVVEFVTSFILQLDIERQKYNADMKTQNQLRGVNFNEIGLYQYFSQLPLKEKIAAFAKGALNAVLKVYIIKFISDMLKDAFLIFNAQWGLSLFVATVIDLFTGSRDNVNALFAKDSVFAQDIKGELSDTALKMIHGFNFGQGIFPAFGSLNPVLYAFTVQAILRCCTEIFVTFFLSPASRIISTDVVPSVINRLFGLPKFCSDLTKQTIYHDVKVFGEKICTLSVTKTEEGLKFCHDRKDQTDIIISLEQDSLNEIKESKEYTDKNSSFRHLHNDKSYEVNMLEGNKLCLSYGEFEKLIRDEAVKALQKEEAKSFGIKNTPLVKGLCWLFSAQCPALLSALPILSVMATIGFGLSTSTAGVGVAYSVGVGLVPVARAAFGGENVDRSGTKFNSTKISVSRGDFNESLSR